MSLHYNSFIPQLGKYEVHIWLLAYLENKNLHIFSVKKSNNLDFNSGFCFLSDIISHTYGAKFL